MKNMLKGFLAVALVVGMTGTAMAAEPTAKELDPATSHLTQEYPAYTLVVPQVPSSIDNTEEVMTYVAAVQEYMAQVQSYIDGATVDLNNIAEKRNKAITDANKVVADYNQFFEANAKKGK